MAEPPEPYRQQILDGLIRLRREGKFQAVWCDGGLPSVRVLPYGDPEVLLWEEAAMLTGVVVPQKMEPVKQPYYLRWRTGRRLA